MHDTLPHFISLVRACRPPVLFGEQVASAAVFGKSAKRVRGEPEWAWLDDLSDRLEAAHYAVGASDIPAAGVGAPHIRQRTFFGAVRLEHPAGNGRQQRGAEPSGRGLDAGCSPERLADANGVGHTRTEKCGLHRKTKEPKILNNDSNGSGMATERLADASGERCGKAGSGSRRSAQRIGDGGQPERLADTNGCGQPGQGIMGRSSDPAPEKNRQVDRTVNAGGLCARGGTDHGGWDDVDWLFCRDGKWRPVKSSLQRVASRIPGSVVPCGDFVSASTPLAQNTKEARRVMRLRGYGNAIVPQAAALFIRAFDTTVNK